MLKAEVFPDDWKKATLFQAIKKESKIFFKNYRPTSLLPIFSEMFEKFTYNSLYNYFMQNKRFTDCQSGFMPYDSCRSQLLPIIRVIYKIFDGSPPVDVTGIFRHFESF